MVLIKSSDEVLFNVKNGIAVQWMVLEDDGGLIPIPRVSSETLKLVVEYCSKHVPVHSSADYQKDFLKKWDERFMREIKIDKRKLFELMDAANFLYIEDLIDLTSQTVADIIKEKSPEQIRAFFDISDDVHA